MIGSREEVFLEKAKELLQIMLRVLFNLSCLFAKVFLLLFFKKEGLASLPSVERRSGPCRPLLTTAKNGRYRAAIVNGLPAQINAD